MIQNKKQLSKELESLIDELVDNLIKGKQLFKKIDELALREGFKVTNIHSTNNNNHDNELDTIIYQKYQNALKSHNENNNTTFNNVATDTKTNNHNPFQHFQ